MSDAKPADQVVQAGPDDALQTERLGLLLKVDEIDRQTADLRRSIGDLGRARRTLRGRLDEIAAELRGRAAARAAAASAVKDAE